MANFTAVATGVESDDERQKMIEQSGPSIDMGNVVGHWSYGNGGAFSIQLIEGKLTFEEKDWKGELTRGDAWLSAELYHKSNADKHGEIRLQDQAGKIISNFRKPGHGEHWGPMVIATKQLTCTERILAAVPVWIKTSITLIMHLIDWGSDILVMKQFWEQGDKWWATISLSFILLGGGLAAVLAMKRKVRGGRLILYILGMGPVVEVATNPKMFYEKKELLRLVEVRGAETFAEAIPSAALQIYAIVFRQRATVLQYCSASISVMSAGYGVMSCCRDWEDQDIRRVSRPLKNSAAIWILIMTDFIWRVVPIAVFFSDPQFRPWSIQAGPPVLYIFELAILVYFEEKFGLTATDLGPVRWIVYLIGAMASNFTLSLRLFLLLIQIPTTPERVKSLWISHLGQSAVRIGAVVVVQENWQFLSALLSCCALSTAAVWVLIQAKWKDDADHKGWRSWEFADRLPDDEFEKAKVDDQANDLLCFFW